MGIRVHFQPGTHGNLWNMRVWQSAWDGNLVWDLKGLPAGDTVDFLLPDTADPRKLQFKFHATDPATGQTTWEADAFTRRLYLSSSAEVWAFDSSPRILYQDPFPAGAGFKPGDLLTFQGITRTAFRGGQLFVWNPYDPSVEPVYFTESARDDASGVSTFLVPLLPWMSSGFHLKWMRPATGGQGAVWEPDASNRVWRPCDGASLWLKSGQCDLRSQPLTLTPAAMEVLYGANLDAPPGLVLEDLVEGSAFPLACGSTQPFDGSPLFRIATYEVPIYPGASYAVSSQPGLETPPIQRPFPADPSAPDTVSRLALGAGDWLAAFPAVARVPLAIQPQPASSFTGGLSVQVAVGNGPCYQTVAASPQPDGTWLAGLNLALDTTTAIDLVPALGAEPKPYAWIDTSRYFTPTAATPAVFTTEGVFGVCAGGATRFADPPDRTALMRAAFGSAATAAGVFAPREMPHGPTVLDGQVWFAVHAPHAIRASLILVDETFPGGPVRREYPMSLTFDTFYWWCSLPVQQAPPGTRYRFLLNDDVEVLDPAARAIQDGGSLKTVFGENPDDPATSWSVLVDVAAVSAAAHAQPWQTMGWHAFLIYELHARRFTNLQPGTLSSFDLLADEWNDPSRLGLEEAASATGLAAAASVMSRG